MHKIYTTRIHKFGILPAKSRHKGAKNSGVFDIVELEGTFPQAVDDLPLRAVGAFQNSKYSGIFVRLQRVNKSTKYRIDIIYVFPPNDAEFLDYLDLNLTLPWTLLSLLASVLVLTRSVLQFA